MLRRRLTRIAIVLLSTAVLGELWLRATDWQPATPFFVVDSKIGRRLLPNLDRNAWGGNVLSDARGLRVGDRGDSPPDRPRVLFLGGSSTFGYGVDWNDTYPARFAAVLAATGTEVEILNAGVPLGDAANRRAFLELHGDELAPSLIVFSEAINDLAAVHAGAHQCWDLNRLLLHVTYPDQEWWPIPDPTHDELLVPMPPVVVAGWLQGRFNWVMWGLFANVRPAVMSFGRSHAPFTWMYRRDPEKYHTRLVVGRAASRHGFALYRDSLHAIASWGRERSIPVVFVVQPRKGQQDLFELLPADARAETARAGRDFLDGDPAEAARRLAAVVAQHPRFITPRYDLAVALLASDRAAAAQEQVEAIEFIHTVAHNLLMSRIGYDEGVTMVHAELAFQSRRADDLFLADGIHPATAGNAIIGGALARAVRTQGLLAHAPNRKR